MWPLSSTERQPPLLPSPVDPLGCKNFTIGSCSLPGQLWLEGTLPVYGSRIPTASRNPCRPLHAEPPGSSLSCSWLPAFEWFFGPFPTRASLKEADSGEEGIWSEMPCSLSWRLVYELSWCQCVCSFRPLPCLQTKLCPTFAFFSGNWLHGQDCWLDGVICHHHLSLC